MIRITELRLKGEVQGQKVREHDFEITSDPKRTQRGPNFWSSFEAKTLRRQRGGHAHFPPKRAPKIEIGN